MFLYEWGEIEINGMKCNINGKINIIKQKPHFVRLTFYNKL